MSREEYIDRYKDEAVKEMLANGIPASITLAQGILESNDGNSHLARYANNHFGIKCKSNWTGLSFYQDDDEKNECFRKYHHAYDSYKDHSEFLKTRAWYAPLFKLKVSDFRGWALGLEKAGYATNPEYAELLIKLIEDFMLYRFDKLNEIPALTYAGNNFVSSVAKPTGLENGINVKSDLKFIVVKTGDTPWKIAKQYELALRQIYKYNDLKMGDSITPGEIIYLEPKGNKVNDAFHLVLKGETMRSIAQMYGVKLKKLNTFNGMSEGEECSIGYKLLLDK